MKTKILIVDDSSAVRGLWRKFLAGEPDFEVSGAVSNGKLALGFLDKTSVDVVLLDLEMPELDGMSALPAILKQHPGIKVIVVSALTARGSVAAVQALVAGASDYMTKSGTQSVPRGLEETGRELIAKIRAVAPPRRPQPTNPVRVTAASPRQRPEVVVIGSSTGGPCVLASTLAGLPSAPKVPILIVQHMPAFFITVLAERLRSDTGLNCVEAQDGQPLAPGTVYLAPGDYHMVVARESGVAVIRLNQNPPENFCRPAVDPMFRSAAAVFGAKVCAFVLTGMGEDGLTGAAEIARAGGEVIVQDEASSVVWGMPGAVARAGLAQKILGPDDLRSTLAERAGAILKAAGNS